MKKKKKTEKGKIKINRKTSTLFVWCRLYFAMLLHNEVLEHSLCLGSIAPLFAALCWEPCDNDFWHQPRPRHETQQWILFQNTSNGGTIKSRFGWLLNLPACIASHLLIFYFFLWCVLLMNECLLFHYPITKLKMNDQSFFTWK